MAEASAMREVELTIPGRAEYALLARLALSAVCRLTPLSSEDCADLKLAVTEVAAMRGGDDHSQTLGFTYRLEEERLVIDVAGGAPGEEAELGRALVEATVDECEFGTESIRLVKRLS